MTPDRQVYETLLTSGLKGAKSGWPIGGAPPLPWFIYKRSKGGEFYADDSNYMFMRRYEVDLYQREDSEEEVEALEEALAQIGPFRFVEKWITSENCWVSSYYVTYHED